MIKGVFARPVCCVLVVAILGVLAGCGGDNQTGVQVKPGEAEVKATNNMADFMKKGADKKPGAKK